MHTLRIKKSAYYLIHINPIQLVFKPNVKDSISARILGGTKVAGNGEYPWQCLLITSDGSYCGCVVVDSKMILTAAHCVVSAAEA